MMEQFVIVLLASFAAVFIATALFYECLCLISRFVSGMTTKHRPIMFVMIGGIFVAHAISILVYAVIFWALIHYAGFADLSGHIPDHFRPIYIFLPRVIPRLVWVMCSQPKVCVF